MTRIVPQLLQAAVVAIVASGPAAAFTFDNIDGGSHDTDAWKGHPVLVVNTASQCGFTGQYEGLQALHERYAAQGLVVLAVPSDDFNQELGSAAEVKDFCDVTYGLTLPMTDITHVRGAAAHPFYQWVAGETGFVPSWNFNKVLIGADGNVRATFGSGTQPESPDIIELIDAELALAPR